MRLVCVCPSPALDHTMVVPSLTGDETVRASMSVTKAGGKGVNVARFASGFGAEAAVVTLLGEYGADLFSTLASREGLEVAAVTAPGVATRICPVLVSTGGGCVLPLADPAPRVDEATWSAFLSLAARVAAGADVVAVSGSFPRVDGIDAVRSLLDALGSAAPRWVDTSGRALVSAAAVEGVALKVNVAEAGKLLGWEDRDAGSALDRAVAAAAALGSGRDVVVTAGGAGAASSTAAGLRTRAAPAVGAVNPTASGDALLAAYLCAGQMGLEAIKDPLLAGVLAGAVNACSWWPEAPAAAVLDLLARVEAG